MWIRTQDKETLINVNCIDMYNINKDEWIIEACDNNNLGTYNSKERAIEVLNEIQTWIERYEAAKVSGKLFIAFITYEMPKE